MCVNVRLSWIHILMVMGKIIHNQIERNKNSSFKSCKNCYARWDKRFAYLVGMICFLAIFSILINEVCNSPTTNSTIPNPSQPEIANYKRLLTTTICSIQNCKLRCTHATDVDLDEEIKEGLKLLDQSCDVKLEITALQLPYNMIPENWLNDIGRDIKELTITTSPMLLEISEGAFSSSFLEGLSTLIIVKCGIKNFYKDMFKGMSRLSSFRLEYAWDALTTITVENNFFTHVSSSLTTLQLTMCILSSDTLRNITNSEKLPILNLIDLRSSSIRTLEAEVFDQVPGLRALYLGSTSLESLDVNVFARSSSLNLIGLENNCITTLPEGIFDHISLGNNTSIDLRDNNFNCDCELKWLKKMYLDNSYIKGPVKCGNDGSLLDELDFCSDGEVSTEGSTNNLKTLKCIESLVMDDKNIAKDLVDFQSITVLEQMFNFTFYETTNSPLLIKIDISTTADLNDFSLLWFNSYDPSEDECISTLKNELIIDKMGQNKTYTICVLRKTEVTVSPYNCFGFKVRVEYPERAWIKNKSRNTIIGISIGILIGCMLISMCFMYLCVRFYPKLIKGNSRVIIIGKEKPKPQSVLTEYERPNYTAPSVVSYNSAQPSYITTSHYSKLTNRDNRSALDNIREESIYNGEISYINPSNSLEHDNINNWRQTVTVKVTDENGLYEPIPPPLPPPNQKQFKIIPCENLYSAA